MFVLENKINFYKNIFKLWNLEHVVVANLGNNLKIIEKNKEIGSKNMVENEFEIGREIGKEIGKEKGIDREMIKKWIKQGYQDLDMKVVGILS